MPRKSKHYFDNARVEKLLTRYVDGACIDVALRDELMEHAVPLIRGVIRSNQLSRRLHYRHSTNEDELIAVAWQQIEKTLYKFEPGRAKAFSMWTQIAFSVCMAHIKKESRDNTYVRRWREGEPHPRPLFERRKKPDFYGILDELREACADRSDYVEMIDLLGELYETEERPWIGLVGKLSATHGRTKAKAFLEHVRGLEIRL